MDFDLLRRVVKLLIRDKAVVFWSRLRDDQEFETFFHQCLHGLDGTTDAPKATCKLTCPTFVQQPFEIMDKMLKDVPEEGRDIVRESRGKVFHFPGPKEIYSLFAPKAQQNFYTIYDFFECSSLVETSKWVMKPTEFLIANFAATQGYSKNYFTYHEQKRFFEGATRSTGRESYEKHEQLIDVVELKQRGSFWGKKLMELLGIPEAHAQNQPGNGIDPMGNKMESAQGGLTEVTEGAGKVSFKNFIPKDMGDILNIFKMVGMSITMIYIIVVMVFDWGEAFQALYTTPEFRATAWGIAALAAAAVSAFMELIVLPNLRNRISLIDDILDTAASKEEVPVVGPGDYGEPEPVPRAPPTIDLPVVGEVEVPGLGCAPEQEATGNGGCVDMVGNLVSGFEGEIFGTGATIGGALEGVKQSFLGNANSFGKSQVAAAKSLLAQAGNVRALNRQLLARNQKKKAERGVRPRNPFEFAKSAAAAIISSANAIGGPLSKALGGGVGDLSLSGQDANASAGGNKKDKNDVFSDMLKKGKGGKGANAGKGGRAGFGGFGLDLGDDSDQNEFGIVSNEGKWIWEILITYKFNKTIFLVIKEQVFGG